MELKFHFITFLVLFSAFATIESRRSGGRSRPSSSSFGSRPSSSHSWSSSGSRPSSSHTWSSSGSRPSTSHTLNNNRPSVSTGSFLNAERGHSSSSPGNRLTNSGSNPYRDASAPSLGNSGNRNPFRPFGTVPPPRHTGSSGNEPPYRPFGTVPPPRHIGFPSPATQRPIGFVIPPRPIPAKPTIPPIIHRNQYPGTNVHPRPGSTVGHRNSTGSNILHPPTPGHFNNSRGGGYNPVPPPRPHPTQGYQSPGAGYNTQRPPTSGHFNNSRGGGYNPVSPPKPYPTQGYNNGGVNYPGRQPAYNPSYPSPSYNPSYPSPSYNPAYPGYHPGAPAYVPVNPSHVYHQTGPSLPPNPSHTIIFVPGQSNSYGSYSRSTGDIFKEALIHAGVNAAVNRLTSPNHYGHDYHHNSWNNYGTPPQGSSSVSSTHTQTITNNYYGELPGSSSSNGGGSNLPPYNPSQNYPSGGGQGGSLPPSGTYPSVNNGNLGSQNSQSNPQLPSNGQSFANPNVNKEKPETEYKWPGDITDEVLWNITEKLFAMDEPVYKFISINLQNQTALNNTNVTDASPQPLFSIHPDAYQVPTIHAIRTLYEVNFAVENKTRESSRREEALLVDVILNTNVMAAAMHFLEQRNLIKNDYFKNKDFLKRIWFAPYDGSSSGFKRVFQGEVIGGEILYGIQDWITFDYHETSKRANYLSYIEKIQLGQNATIVKINYEMSGIKKLGSGILVGTSPELEMALYTICHYARPNNYCVISLGGTKLTIYTHTFRYFGDDLIDLAFPMI